MITVTYVDERQLDPLHATLTDDMSELALENVGLPLSLFVQALDAQIKDGLLDSDTADSLLDRLTMLARQAVRDGYEWEPTDD